MEKKQVLINNQIRNPTEALSRAERISISSIMDYIVRTEKIALIKPWFAEFSNAHIHQVQRNYNAKTIVQDMGIEYIPVYKRNVNDENYDFSLQ